jgi:hypothetical protein
MDKQVEMLPYLLASISYHLHFSSNYLLENMNWVLSWLCNKKVNYRLGFNQSLYEAVFELLLRFRASYLRLTIWNSMQSVSKRWYLDFVTG